jgi:hypothetical protein
LSSNTNNNAHTKKGIAKHNERDITSTNSSSTSIIVDVDHPFVFVVFVLVSWVLHVMHVFECWLLGFACSFLFTAYKLPAGQNIG